MEHESQEKILVLPISNRHCGVGRVQDQKHVSRGNGRTGPVLSERDVAKDDAWLTAQRVARARQLLETTDLTIDAVASRSGLGSAANLRSRLREAVGVSPSSYRSRFARREALTPR